MKSHSSLNTNSFGQLLPFCLGACLTLLGSSASSGAQTTLNVTNFGARGDAVQFWVNTASNFTIVTTTNQLSSADIGKTIEIFGAGPQTIGVNSSNVMATNNQDWVGVITNIYESTNIYVTAADFPGQPPIPQDTLTNAFGTYGTDNTAAFSNAIAFCGSNTTATINIPNGTYLLIPTWHISDGYAYGSIMIHRGGLNFVGQSEGGTILLSKGAWIVKNTQDGTVYDGCSFRGFLFEITAPITNDYPLNIQNLTLDGGVQEGNQYVHGVTINLVDGNGWDQQHSAYLTWDSGSQTGTATHQFLTNVTVRHWRGEMLKTIDQNTNGNISVYNCSFLDGNATAINLFPSLDCRNCVFSNLFQVAEVYQSYYTNTAFFVSNYTTNITGNGWAWNGGLPTSPQFTMQSNLFYFNGYGYNGIQTTPGINISILNNQIHCADYMVAFAIGSAGSQGRYANSQILISGNSVYADAWNSTYPANSGILTAFVGFGGPGVTSVNGLTIVSNTVTAEMVQNILMEGSYETNVAFHYNSFVDTCASFSMDSGRPMVLIDASDTYTPFQLSGNPGTTNLVSYGTGPLHLTQFVGTGATFILNDTNGIPAGAWMKFDNTTNTQGIYYNLYLSTSLSNYVTVTNGQSLSVYWNGVSWTTNSAEVRPLPPANLRIVKSE